MDPEIAEILGGEDNRSRSEMQRDALRDWLAMSKWKRSEAIILLAGLDPIMSPLISDRGWWPLPGTSTSLESWEMEERLEAARDLDLKLRMPPGEVIAVALRANIMIPWLEIAAADQKCKLPLKIRNAVVKNTARIARAGIGIKERNRKAKERHAEARRPAVNEANKLINLLSQQGRLPVRADGSLIVSQLHQELEKIGFQHTERTLRNWIAEGWVVSESAK